MFNILKYVAFGGDIYIHACMKSHLFSYVFINFLDLMSLTLSKLPDLGKYKVFAMS